MTNGLSRTNDAPLARIASVTGFERGKIELIKETIAKGATDDELMLFLHLAQRSGLDPFSRQIYLIERRANVNGQWTTTRMPQTGIDGLRLIADRTGNYAPGRAPTFVYDANGMLDSATSYVMKFVRGTWMEVAATAHYTEYVQAKKDGEPTQMWREKPHIMLAKCAEALALRRAFPADLSGLYTGDEIPGDVLPPPTVNAVTGEITSDPAAAKAPLISRTRDKFFAKWSAYFEPEGSIDWAYVRRVLDLNADEPEPDSVAGWKWANDQLEALKTTRAAANAEELATIPA